MSGWTCGGCGKQSPEGTSFCGFCGARAAEAPAAATWSCRDCGTANLEGHAFCGGCGAQAQRARAEELRLVTALFADISGFTTLADTMDIESLHDVITPLVAGLSRIAERYGGFIEKYAGDALLVVYGAPVTHEDDAQRALLAALDMHAELPRLLAELGPAAAHLTIHVGVNTGRVIAHQAGSEQQSDYSVLGDSVILAQRLESVCPAGETYVGPTTYELCRDEFEFEPVGELTLKGKVKPVEGFRLLGRRQVFRTDAAPLVGRAAELAAVEDGLATADVTTLLGEPGLGKTRLLAEVRERAMASGTRWLAARCLSYGAALAYWPIADLLRQDLELRIEDGPEQVEQRVAQRLPPDAQPGAHRLLALVAEGNPETARREIHDAVGSWLRACGPAVLALEDVHWADSSTVDLLAELVRTRSVPVALLLTGRDEGRASADAVVGEGVHRLVELRPLEAGAIGALAGAVLSGEVGTDLRDLLVERTAGNPLHVTELTRSLVEADHLVSTIDGWSLRPGWDPAGVPTTIERIFATRLDTLPPPAAALLQLTSVIGRTVRLSLLRTVDDVGDLDTRLAVLLDAGMLVRTTDSGESAVTFSHALLQEVVYERLLRKRRRDLHRRVADVARSMYGDGDDTIGLLARHLYLADAGEEAIEPLLRAGRVAAGVFANDAAVVHLERAVTLLEMLHAAGPRLNAARLQLADLHLLRGSYPEAVGLCRALIAEGDARGWVGLLAAQHAAGDYPAVMASFAEALVVVPPQSTAATPLWLHCGTTLMSMGRYGDAVSTFKTGLRLAAPAEVALRGRLLTEMAHCETQLNLHQESLQHAQEAVRLLGTNDDLRALLAALRVCGAALIYAGEADEARQTLTHGLQVAHRTGALLEAAGCLVNLGMLAMERGEHEHAAAQFRQALVWLERLGHRQGQAVAAGNLADALARLGQPDPAQAAAERALELGQRLGHRTTVADVTRTLARVALLRHQQADAVRLGREAAELFRGLDAPDEVRTCEDLLADAEALLADPAGRAADYDPKV